MVVAGYLNILLGALTLFGVPYLPIMAGFIGFTLGLPVGIGLIVVGVISVLGGISGLYHRSYVSAIIGSITAWWPSLTMVLGVFAFVFTTIGKQDFKM